MILVIAIHYAMLAPLLQLITSASVSPVRCGGSITSASDHRISSTPVPRGSAPHPGREPLRSSALPDQRRRPPLESSPGSARFARG